MDSPSTITAADSVRAAHGTFPLKSGGTAGVFRNLERSGDGIPLKRDTHVFNRVERPGTTAIPLNGEEDAALRDAKLREAARGFEAIFIRQLLKTMRSTVPGANPYGQGASGEIFGDVIENALSETMSRQESFGIARLLVGRLGAKARISPGQTMDKVQNGDSASVALPGP